MKQFTMTCQALNITKNFDERLLKILCTPPVRDPRRPAMPIWDDIDALGQNETFTFHYHDRTWQITRTE